MRGIRDAFNRKTRGRTATVNTLKPKKKKKFWIVDLVNDSWIDENVEINKSPQEHKWPST